MSIKEAFLSPCGVALGHLIELYASSPDMILEMRQAFSLLLVEQLSEQPGFIVEPRLPSLRNALTPLPTTLCEGFDKRLSSTTEPDDLWTLMNSLSQMLQPTLALDDCVGPSQIERSSVRADSLRPGPFALTPPSLLSSDPRHLRAPAASRLSEHRLRGALHARRALCGVDQGSHVGDH